ncbi:hypothetical protein ID866_3804 [Astraeus odoratus]|nr:hypothetical protein ID866_3804 [Astraeus odoratus]
MMDCNSFASLATFKLPSPCRLLTSACCPDKDLVVLITRLGGRDRVSLWKMQGSKKWEVDIAPDVVPATVVGLAWSPSGQTIAVVHDSGRITMHSVQDGHVERSLFIRPSDTTQIVPEMVEVWWLPGYRAPTTGVIPDIFKRNGVKTGSALSILKLLPLLDPMKDAGGNVTATDLFAFQGTQTRTLQQASIPDVIDQWPSLSHALDNISVNSPNQTDDIGHEGGHSGGLPQTSDEDSLLVLSDAKGGLHLFLDGCYFIGSISLTGGLPCTFAYKHPSQPLLLLHPGDPTRDLLSVGIQPLSVSIPLLDTPTVRDFARLSSTARELMMYIMTALDEMREGWFGSATVTSPKEIGKKWVQALQKKLSEEYGYENPDVILELTGYLASGTSSEGLTDFILSSDQTSERALQKWESSLTDALTKMREYSNSRIIPAFQRLHVILDEICGWSHMPGYAVFGLDTSDIASCMTMVERGIFVSAWLAAEARRELRAFKQFLTFIRYDAATSTLSGEARFYLDFDILEVNGYLMSGLVTSQIDQWFTGSAPQFNPGDLFPSQTPKTLEEALQLAHTALQDPSQTAWQPDIMSVEPSHLGRNLEALVQELATQCQQIFARASQAAARSAVVAAEGGAVPPQVEKASLASENPDVSPQYLVIHFNAGGRSFYIEVALIECSVDGENNVDECTDLDILDAEFFDNEVIVLVYQIKGTQGPIYVATANYTTLKYEKLVSEKYVSGPARKDMIANVLQQWSGGHALRAALLMTACPPAYVRSGSDHEMPPTVRMQGWPSVARSERESGSAGGVHLGQGWNDTRNHRHRRGRDGSRRGIGDGHGRGMTITEWSRE